MQLARIVCVAAIVLAADVATKVIAQAAGAEHLDYHVAAVSATGVLSTVILVVFGSLLRNAVGAAAAGLIAGASLANNGELVLSGSATDFILIPRHWPFTLSHSMGLIPPAWWVCNVADIAAWTGSWLLLAALLVRLFTRPV